MALSILCIFFWTLTNVNWNGNLLFDLLYARAQYWAFISDHGTSLFLLFLTPIFLIWREKEITASVFTVTGLAATKELLNVLMLFVFDQFALGRSIFFGQALILSWGFDLTALIFLCLFLCHRWQKKLIFASSIFIVGVLTITYTFNYIYMVPAFVSTIIPDNPHIPSQYFLAFWNNLYENGFWVGCFAFCFTPKRWWM